MEQAMGQELNDESVCLEALETVVGSTHPPTTPLETGAGTTNSAGKENSTGKQPAVKLPDTSITATAEPAPVSTEKTRRKKETLVTVSNPARGPTATALTPAVDDEKKLTGKELKEMKKAQKAARRQQEKTGLPSQLSKPAEQKPQTQLLPPSQSKQQQQAKGTKKAVGSPGSGVGTGAVGNAGPVSTLHLAASKAEKGLLKDSETRYFEQPGRDKGLVGILKDLELEQGDKKKNSGFGINNAHPDVHPAILTLGMQINKRVLSGSSARCLGFLLAIKRMIEDYETPRDSTLNRHLPGAYLSHQINFLLSARSMSTSMGNAIRWLKTEISNISPEITDEVAKRDLVVKIESFIDEKLLAAEDMIVNTACGRYIQNHDVILTYSKSHIVEATLLEAHSRGIQFRVVVVDNSPHGEGWNIFRGLRDAGIDCSFIHLLALNRVMDEVTIVFFGAHALMANGALYSRAGTAVAAMAASNAGVPIIVLCESIKFSERINIDRIANNELGDPELLVSMGENAQFPQPGHPNGWKDALNTTVVDFMFDLTPSECLAIVVCEHGCITPEGVSAVIRLCGMDR